MRKFVTMSIWILLITSCVPASPTPAPTLDVSVIHTQAAQAFIATMTAEAGERTPTPTDTATHTPTPTDTPTPIPAPTSTPTFTPTPTDTPVVPAATPTPTFTPTLTPTPSYEFMYEEGSMQTAPNCAAVYLKINVVGVGGEPVNDITVRLQWVGFTDHMITGRGRPGEPLGTEPPGEVGFAPLGLDHYHAPMDFHIQLVQSPSDPTPRSDEKTIHFTSCATAGQFTNIKFVYQW